MKEPTLTVERSHKTLSSCSGKYFYFRSKLENGCHKIRTGFQAWKHQHRLVSCTYRGRAIRGWWVVPTEGGLSEAGWWVVPTEGGLSEAGELYLPREGYQRLVSCTYRGRAIRGWWVVPTEGGLSEAGELYLPREGYQRLVSCPYRGRDIRGWWVVPTRARAIKFM